MAKRKEMIELDTQISITIQCFYLGVSRSSFYYQPVGESDSNLALMAYLDKLYMNVPFYGYRKLLELVKQEYGKVNSKRLCRLLKQINWQTIYPVRTTFIDKAKYKYPYLLNNLDINYMNQVWAIDITYIPMKKGFMYLFAIIDHYSRKVVGWSLSNSMSASWCVECIRGSIKEHGKPQIINSDQGVQFTSDEYVSFLLQEQIQISMDAKGRYKDNIFIERLWRSVKYEHVYLHAYEDGSSLWLGINKYFAFYNTERIHENLGYKTPDSIYFSKAA